MDSLILQKITKLLVPFIQLYGFYVMLHGHLSPGGGFAGGAIVGASLVLYCLVFGLDNAQKLAPHKFTSFLETGGVLTFILLGLVGVFVGKQFLTNLAAGFEPGTTFNLLSAGIVPYISVTIGLKVASTVVTLFFTIVEDDNIS